jgi:hypothetical protein
MEMTSTKLYVNYTSDIDWTSGGTSFGPNSMDASVASGIGGAVSATLPEDELDAFNESIRNGGAEGIVSIGVDLPTGSSSLELTVPASTAAALSETGDVSFCITSDFAH